MLGLTKGENRGAQVRGSGKNKKQNFFRRTVKNLVTNVTVTNMMLTNMAVTNVTVTNMTVSVISALDVVVLLGLVRRSSIRVFVV